jgi:hypothetical protein
MAAGGETVIIRLESAPHVYAISDIHTIIPENRKWVDSLSHTGPSSSPSILLVAGDVAEDSSVLLHTLSALQSAFSYVFFVPGNHDLWVKSPGVSEVWANSVDKLQSLLSKCVAMGVHTHPVHFVWSERGLWVVPIFSWYHPSFDRERDIPPNVAAIPPIEKVFQDFRRCVWPSGLDPLQTHVAKYFDDLNDTPPHTTVVSRSDADVVISFSHFLPRIELLPEKRYLFYPNLAKAVGSDYLQRRVAALSPSLHVFGHTHFGWDATVDGVRYVQAALGYPHERKQRMPSLYVGHNENRECESPFTTPLLVFDGHTQALVPPLWSSWPQKYLQHPRDPENVELAPWVRNLWPQS